MESSSVDALMKKAVTTSNEFYADPNSVKGPEQLRTDRRKERVAKKTKLQQWYGMKRQVLTPEVKEELELLKYRNFLNKDTAHQAPKKVPSAADEGYFEVGYFSNVGKKKRNKSKSFAEEWMLENEELAEVVRHRMHRNTRLNRKARAIEDKKKKAVREKKEEQKRGSKRKKRSKGADEL